MRGEHLSAFEAVARLGTFTRAAEEQFVAQPSLSRQIRSLEAELGAALFRRGRRGAELTDAGRVLLPIARRMLADAEVVRSELDELAGLRRGRVRLGAPPTLCVSLVADVLAVFHDRFPGVDLEVSEAGSLSVVDQLVTGELDLAVIVTRGGSPRIDGAELIPLLEERLVVASSAAAPAPGGAEGPAAGLTLTELADLPQVAFHRSYDLRAATDAAFASAGLTPTVAVEGAEMDAVLRFVERGIGVAVVPAMTVLDRPGLRSIPLVEPVLERTVNLARRPEVRLSTAATAMQQLVFERVGRMEVPGVVGPAR
ncbi:LysR family transcriptional regulator [Brachybacterium sp. P6-10-X1]|uniref:LysR family transcriptional regulator n=1 Tax=Brachybacterium sp. P6-10-X1 TaxID=1903186 RepID=UPI0009717E79|nr:LysR substrate-binding domain-containing protein [Brachybacterium sp. P6-10-X1]APX33418.1 LysR family transcriptional regulator [Brachybacterium sp. P6-10-X1]